MFARVALVLRHMISFARPFLNVAFSQSQALSLYVIGCKNQSLLDLIIFREESRQKHNLLKMSMDKFSSVDLKPSNIEKEQNEIIEYSSKSHSKVEMENLLNNIFMLPLNALTTWGPNAPYDIILSNCCLDSPESNAFRHIFTQLK